MNLDYTPILPTQARILNLNLEKYLYLNEDVEVVKFGYLFKAKQGFIFDGCSRPNFINRWYKKLIRKDIQREAKDNCFFHDIMYAAKYPSRWKADLLLLRLAFHSKEYRIMAVIKYLALLVGGWPAYNKVTRLDTYNRVFCSVEKYRPNIKKDFADKPSNFTIHPKDVA
jgi:hypothetical protein